MDMSDKAGHAAGLREAPPRGRSLFGRIVWSWAAFFRWSAATIVALLMIALLWLYFLDWNTMRGPLARYASHRLGREVHIAGNLEVRLFSFTPSMSVHGVRVANPAWVGQPLAADIGDFSVSVRLMPLLYGKLILPSVEFDDPNILVVRDKQGRTNWDFRGSAQGQKIPPIQRFVVRNGQLRIDDRLRRMVFAGMVSSNERAGGGDHAFELTGEGTLNGNKFVADIHGGALINVDESKPYHFAADVRSGTTHAVADGAFPRPFHLGQFWAATTFSGPTMADLYYLTGLAFPNTPPYRLSGTLTRDGSLFHFADIKGLVGSSDMHGDVTAQTADTPTFVRAQLTSRQLNFDDLGPLIGAPPPGAARKGSAAASTRVLPDAPLYVERIRQMNADVQYDAATIKSQDFPLRDLHLHVVLNNGVMTLDPITFDFTRGKLNASLKVDARKDVAVSDLDARLSNIRLEQFVHGNPPAVEGLLAARAQMHTVGNSVRKAAATANGALTFVVPSGKVRKSFAELTGIDLLNGLGLLLTNDKSDTGLRCAVARFDARDGVMTARQFTIDTDPVLINGSGTINLRDESLNLAITGKPKEFRIGRLRAPISIGGSLGSPSVGVKAGPALAQGGIAAALGVLNPFAALLAFVDPGLAKDANCVALSENARKGPAPVKTPSRRR